MISNISKVVKMKSQSIQKLRVVKLEIAIEILNKYPNLFTKLTSDKGYVMTEKEDVAAQVLRGMFETDPVLQAILAKYYK